MSKCKICERCGESIDRYACGEAHAVVTVRDDTANDPAKYRERRFYLCGRCVSDLEYWLLMGSGRHLRLLRGASA